MVSDTLDSFLLRVAYEILLQAYRDRHHRNQLIALEAQNYLRSEEASVMCEALIGIGAVWSPLSVRGGRPATRSSLKGKSSR